MKISYCNLEKLRYSTQKSRWYSVIDKQAFEYQDECLSCGEPYLRRADSCGSFCSYECMYKSESYKHRVKETHVGFTGKSHTGITREKMSKSHAAIRGERHSRWKGGITPKNMQIRNMAEYRSWREAVFARDDWTCQKCLVKGGQLNAHHIKAFAKHPELRFQLTNGVTLCKECHFLITFAKQTNP